MLDIDVLGDNRNDILGVAFAHKTMFAVLVHVYGPTKVKEFHMSVCLGEKRTSRDIFDLIDNNPDRKSLICTGIHVSYYLALILLQLSSPLK